MTDDDEVDPPDGPGESPRFPSRLIELADLHNHRVADFEPNTLVSIGYEEPFEYEGKTHYTVADEWDKSIRIIDDKTATVSEWIDEREAPPGIPWDAYTRLLRAAIVSRRKRVDDVEVVERDEHDMYDGIGYVIRIHNAATIKDVYDSCRTIENELRNPIRQVQMRLAECVDQVELALEDQDQPLTALLAGAQNATTSDEKGTSLERLIAALFRIVPGMQVASKRVRTETEEIDILIYNRRDDAPWRDEGFYIPVECKNWSSRCGKDEVVLFAAKMRNRRGRARCGVFVSWNGFTGPSRLELLRESANPPLVLLLTAEDVIRAVNEGDFLRVLAERFDEAALA